MECLNTTIGIGTRATTNLKQTRNIRVGMRLSTGSMWTRTTSTWRRRRLDEMHEAGFKPEFGPGVAEQVNEIREELRKEFAKEEPGSGVPDLRELAWSSIDNDTSRDLDQIEVAERVADGIRIHVAIGDVASAVEKDSPIDQHAKAQTQTIYTAVRNFPMLPLELSAGMTSLNENGDRMAVMMSFTVGANGEMSDEQISRAWVRNRAQLAYSRVGPFIDAHPGATSGVGVTLQEWRRCGRTVRAPARTRMGRRLRRPVRAANWQGHWRISC